MRGRRAWLFAITALAYAQGACTAVVLVEGSAHACTNGIDDDGNGQTDCADPSCDGSGVCETTMSACANGVDDDSNGLTDCEEPACQTGGFCNSYIATCSVHPQAGCRSGMGCYRRSMGAMAVELRCRSGGHGHAGALCDLTAIDALRAADAHPCAMGFGCNAVSSVGACGAYCMSDDDCPTGGVCYPLPSTTGFPGLCSMPCDPRVGGVCPTGLACVSFHERGDTYAQGGARWSCVDAHLARGTAMTGQPCVDGAVPSTPAAQVCVSASACIPDVGGATATCRRLCDVHMPDCPAPSSCQMIYPTGSPSAVGNTVFGACL